MSKWEKEHLLNSMRSVFLANDCIKTKKCCLEGVEDAKKNLPLKWSRYETTQYEYVRVDCGMYKESEEWRKMSFLAFYF